MNTNAHRYFSNLSSCLFCPSLFESSFSAILFGSLFFLFAGGVFAQDLPREIRGYKVYKAKIKVQNQPGEKNPKTNDAVINLGDPAPVDLFASGLTFEISGEIATLKQSGRVDFLAFKDFRVNGLAVDIEEYDHSFEFEKNQIIPLPKPIKISLSLTQAARGAFKQWRDSKAMWQVTGRVFVFGRFRKAGFRFKRVIPVDINLQIKNPINN